MRFLRHAPHRAADYDQWGKEASVRPPVSIRSSPGVLDTVFLWGLFGWLMMLVWGSATFWVAVVVLLVLIS
jgi:hypothetical protein